VGFWGKGRRNFEPYDETPLTKEKTMENELVRVPVNLVRVSNNELYAIAFATGVIVTVAYQIGKEAQRRWTNKNTIFIQKTVKK
jgi:hypothetical protein